MAGKEKTRGLLFHSLIYWLGVVLSKLASFILVPVFTHHLSPDDYGILELITTTTSVLALLLSGRISSAVIRFYHKAPNPGEKNQVVSSALLLITGISLAAGVLLFSLAPQFALLVLGSAENALFFRIMFASMLLGLVQDVGMCYLRINEKSILFVSVNFARVVAMLLLNVLFIAYFHLGILGALLGPAIVSAVFAPAILTAVLRETGIHFDRALSGQLIRYSAPLVPAALASFVMHFSDRYIMRGFSDLTELGLYAVAYKFGMLISGFIGQPFGLIWGTRLHSNYWRPDRDALYNKALSGLSFALAGAAAALSLFIDPLLRVMTPSAYWAAAELVPIISAGYVLFVLLGISCAPLHTEARTGLLAMITMASAAVSVILNLILIPVLGGMGAALTTVLAFGVMLLWTRLASMRISSLRLEHDRAWKPMLAAVGVVLVGRFIDDSGGQVWTTLGLKLLLLCAYPVVLLAIGFLRADEKLWLRTRLGGLAMRVRRA